MASLIFNSFLEDLARLDGTDAPADVGPRRLVPREAPRRDRALERPRRRVVGQPLRARPVVERDELDALLRGHEPEQRSPR